MKESKNGFVFEKSDLEKFAESSHDKNPLHVCEDFAKTTVYGENVVFGMLGVTYALEKLDLYVEELKVQFLKPMFLGRMYRLACSEYGTGRSAAILENGSPVLKIHSGKMRRPLPGISPGPVKTADTASVIDPPPLEIVDDFVNGNYILEGIYTSDPSDTHAQVINAKLCSYIVGMIVPGKNSLFMEAAMQVKQKACTAGRLTYRVAKRSCNPPLGLIKLTVEVYDGDALLAVNQLRAYMRASFSAADTLPAFDGSRKTQKTVLVLGGTKGIGAELVKRYAVQGARVIATYYHDAERAATLEKRLTDAKYPVEFIRCDTSDGNACADLHKHLKAKYEAIDTMYLCAALAPHNIELYRETYTVFEAYITQSLRLFYYPFFTFLDLIRPNGQIGIFSSVALLDRQTNHKMVEYLCAKSVIENIVESVSCGERKYPLKFYMIRPPKMLTEMNNTPTGRMNAADPADIAKAIYRKVELAKDNTEALAYLDFDA